MGGNPHRRRGPAAALWRGSTCYADTKRGSSIMFGIIAFIALAIVAVIVLMTVVHLLFSPFLLLVVIGVLAFLKFGPRRSRR